MKQREIKFRAWDEKRKKMRSVIHICLDRDSDRFQQGQYSYPTTDSASSGNTLVGHDWSDTLMQFTGLLDKNGKEIYEGDIVKGKYLSGFDCDNGNYKSSMRVKDFSPEAVKFSNGAFWPREYANLVDDGYYSWRVFDLEIIGNIYENPELCPKTS